MPDDDCSSLFVVLPRIELCCWCSFSVVLHLILKHWGFMFFKAPVNIFKNISSHFLLSICLNIKNFPKAFSKMHYGLITSWITTEFLFLPNFCSLYLNIKTVVQHKFCWKKTYCWRLFVMPIFFLISLACFLC